MQMCSIGDVPKVVFLFRIWIDEITPRITETCRKHMKAYDVSENWSPPKSIG